MVNFTKSKITKIEKLEDFNDEYVYDIVMEDSSTPYFFGNGILVHNSCYFKTYANNKEEAILIADSIGDQVNESFPEFMRNSFMCTEGFDGLIMAGREVVADRTIFQAKKKYLLRVVNLDGNDVEPGTSKSLKAMGSETKKSDTPKVIQKFLKEVINMVLAGDAYSEVETFINNSRKTISSGGDIILIGVSKSVNNLEQFYNEWTRYEKAGIKKVNLPGHVRAAINFNEHVKNIGAQDSQQIISGAKVRIFNLKPNDQKFTSIAISGDLDAMPSWFDDYFKVDIKLTEQKLIDAKLKNLFDAISWTVPTAQSALTNKLVEW